MSSSRYNFRPRQVNRALGPTPDLPGALPATPTGHESSLSEPESIVTPAVRAVRSYSDVVRASSPWNRPQVAKESTPEQVSSGNEPDSESNESDGDDRPWITVQRKRSRERLDERDTYPTGGIKSPLTEEQTQSS